MYQVYIYKPALCLLQKELYLPHSTDVPQLGPGGVYPNALERGGVVVAGAISAFFLSRGGVYADFLPPFSLKMARSPRRLFHPFRDCSPVWGTNYL